MRLASKYPYDGSVNPEESFELPPHASAPAEAVDAAEHGHVVNLTRHGEPVARIVPANEAGTAEDDAASSEVWSYYEHLLGPYPDDTTTD